MGLYSSILWLPPSCDHHEPISIPASVLWEWLLVSYQAFPNYTYNWAWASRMLQVFSHLDQVQELFPTWTSTRFRWVTRNISVHTERVISLKSEQSWINGYIPNFRECPCCAIWCLWLLTWGERGQVTRMYTGCLLGLQRQAGHVVHCSSLGCCVHSIVYVCFSYGRTKYKYSELLWHSLFKCLSWE